MFNFHFGTYSSWYFLVLFVMDSLFSNMRTPWDLICFVSCVSSNYRKIPEIKRMPNKYLWNKWISKVVTIILPCIWDNLWKAPRDNLLSILMYLFPKEHLFLCWKLRKSKQLGSFCWLCQRVCWLCHLSNPLPRLGLLGSFLISQWVSLWKGINSNISAHLNTSLSEWEFVV